MINRYLSHLIIILSLVCIPLSVCGKKKVPLETDNKRNQPEVLYNYLCNEAVPYLYKSKGSAAFDLLTAAHDIYPQGAGACYILANTYFNLREFAKAHKLIEQALASDSANLDYLDLQASVYESEHKPDSAVLIFDKIVELSQSVEDKVLYLGHIYDILSQTGSFERMLGVLQQVEDLQGQDTDVLLKKAEIYSNLRDVEGVEKCVRTLCDINPRNAYEFLTILALTYGNLRMDSLAIETFDKILELNPSAFHGKLGMLDFWMERGRTDKFKEVLISMLVDPQTDAGFKEQILAEILIGYQQMNLSIQDVDDIHRNYFSIEQIDYMTMNNFAYSMAISGEYQDLSYLLNLSAKTLESEPQNGTFLDTYAWIAYLMGQYRTAVEYISKAMNVMDKPNPELYDHAGDILYQVGSVSGALEYWQRAVEVLYQTRSGEINNTSIESLHRKIRANKK